LFFVSVFVCANILLVAIYRIFMKDNVITMQPTNCDAKQAKGQEKENEIPAANDNANLSAADEIQQECICCGGRGGRGCGGVNRELLPSKLFYFFFFAGNGTLIPYLVLYFKQLGLNPSQVGIVSGLKPFISFLFSPIWGYIADKTRQTRLIFVLSLFAYVGGYFAYSLAPAGDLCKMKSNASQSTSHHPFMFHMHRKRSLLSGKVNAYNLFIDHQNVQQNDKKKSDIVKPKKHLIYRYSNASLAEHSRLTYLYAEMPPTIMGESLFHLPVSVAFFGANSNSYFPSVEDDYEISEAVGNDNFKKANTIYSEKTWHGAVHHSRAPWTVCGAAKANTIDSLSLDQSGSKAQRSRVTSIFLYLLVVTVVATLFSCPLITFVDTATIRKLRESDTTHRYGSQRMWGSFGWGLLAFIVGAIISILPLCPGVNNEVNYYPAFYIFSAFLVVSLFCGWKLQFEDNNTHIDLPTTSRTQRIIDGLKLLKDPVYFSFIATSFFIGVTMSVIKTFLFWYLKDIGAPQILFSIIAAVNCISEVTVYFFSSVLIKRLTHFGVLYVALICYALRLFYYGLLTSPWYVLAAEPLSGITTAAAWAAMTSYVGLNASPESVTTMQGKRNFLCACFFIIILIFVWNNR